VYSLIRQQGLSRQETAAQLGISPETVKSNLEEATRKVRAYCLIFLQDIPIVLILLHQKNIF
jgi:RNA polymerase sigma-70 factor (ECF subfamily)